MQFSCIKTHLIRIFHLMEMLSIVHIFTSLFGKRNLKSVLFNVSYFPIYMDGNRNSIIIIIIVIINLIVITVNISHVLVVVPLCSSGHVTTSSEAWSKQ